MESSLSPLSHHFTVVDDICSLCVYLPFLTSFEDVELDVASEAVRIRLPGESGTRHIPWPAEVAGRHEIDKSSAKFSRKKAQLVVKMPLCHSYCEAADTECPEVPAQMSMTEQVATELAQKDCCVSTAGTRPISSTSSTKSSDNVVAQTKGPQQTEHRGQENNKQHIDLVQSDSLREQKVQGSGWNANSWHWEERPMIKWSQSWFEDELSSASWSVADGLAHLRFLDPSDVLKGDISLCVRKGRPVVLYELTMVCRWELKPCSEADGFTRGKFWVRDFTSEEGALEGVDAANIEVDVNIDTSKGRCLSKAVKQEGAKHMRQLLKRFLESLVSQAAVPKA